MGKFFLLSDLSCCESLLRAHFSNLLTRIIASFGTVLCFGTDFRPMLNKVNFQLGACSIYIIIAS